MRNKASEGMLSELAKSAKDFPVLKSTSLSVILLLGSGCSDNNESNNTQVKKAENTPALIKDSGRTGENKVQLNKTNTITLTPDQLKQRGLENRKKKLWNRYNNNELSVSSLLWFIEGTIEEEDGYNILREISQDIIQDQNPLSRMDEILTIRYEIGNTLGRIGGKNGPKYSLAIQTLTDIRDSLNLLGEEEDDYKTVIAYLYSIKSWTEGGQKTGFNVIDHCAEYLSKYPESNYCNSYITDIRKSLESKETKSNQEALALMDSKLIRYFLGDDSGKNEAVGKYISFIKESDSIEEIETKVKLNQIKTTIQRSYELVQYTKGAKCVLYTLLNNYQDESLRPFIISELERLVVEIEKLDELDYLSIRDESRSRMKYFLNEYIRKYGEDQDLARIEASIVS